MVSKNNNVLHDNGPNRYSRDTKQLFNKSFFVISSRCKTDNTNIAFELQCSGKIILLLQQGKSVMMMNPSM
jgi:hypothetical protein